MQHDKNTAPAGAEKTTSAFCGPEACGCPPANDNTGNNTPTKLPKKGFLMGLFKKCSTCACSGAAGFLVGHAGCVMTPLVIAAVGVTTATAGVSILALSFGAAATAGGLYAWHRLRGKQASTFEKRLVIGSALSGLLISGAMMHFKGHDHHSGGHENHTPQQHEQHMHHGMQQGAALSPAAQAWLDAQDAQKRRDIEAMAKATNMSLGEYLNGMCGLPPVAAEKPAAEKPKVATRAAPAPHVH
jgi:hypothetical protein